MMQTLLISDKKRGWLKFDPHAKINNIFPSKVHSPDICQDDGEIQVAQIGSFG